MASEYLFTVVLVERGTDFPALDPIGTSDPYCILKLGKETKQTTVQFKNLNPIWNETFIFEVDRLPQVAFSGPSARKSTIPFIVPLCELMYYITIDIWDRDKMNRDDFMGRVMVPLTTIPHGTVSRWYPLGRSSSGGQAHGRLLLNLTLKALEDDEVRTVGIQLGHRLAITVF